MYFYQGFSSHLAITFDFSALFKEFEGLAEHGVSMPQNMQGLTDEQIEELHLEDEWAEQCTPAGSEPARLQKVPMSRRCGRGTCFHQFYLNVKLLVVNLF